MASFFDPAGTSLMALPAGRAVWTDQRNKSQSMNLVVLPKVHRRVRVSMYMRWHSSPVWFHTWSVQAIGRRHFRTVRKYFLAVVM